MAVRSKTKRREAAEKHRRNKRRARYKRVLEKYRGDMRYADYSNEAFDAMMFDLSQLNIKYLQQLLSDLKSNQGFNDPNKELRNRVELMILERTLLK